MRSYKSTGLSMPLLNRRNHLDAESENVDSMSFLPQENIEEFIPVVPNQTNLHQAVVKGDSVETILCLNQMSALELDHVMSPDHFSIADLASISGNLELMDLLIAIGIPLLSSPCVFVRDKTMDAVNLLFLVKHDASTVLAYFLNTMRSQDLAYSETIKDEFGLALLSQAISLNHPECFNELLNRNFFTYGDGDFQQSPLFHAFNYRKTIGPRYFETIKAKLSEDEYQDFSVKLLEYSLENANVQAKSNQSLSNFVACQHAFAQKDFVAFTELDRFELTQAEQQLAEVARAFELRSAPLQRYFLLCMRDFYMACNAVRDTQDPVKFNQLMYQVSLKQRYSYRAFSNKNIRRIIDAQLYYNMQQRENCADLKMLKHILQQDDKRLLLNAFYASQGLYHQNAIERLSASNHQDILAVADQLALDLSGAKLLLADKDYLLPSFMPADLVSIVASYIDRRELTAISQRFTGFFAKVSRRGNNSRQIDLNTLKQMIDVLNEFADNPLHRFKYGIGVRRSRLFLGVGRRPISGVSLMSGITCCDFGHTGDPDRMLIPKFSRFLGLVFFLVYSVLLIGFSSRGLADRFVEKSWWVLLTAAVLLSPGAFQSAVNVCRYSSRLANLHSTRAGLLALDDLSYLPEQVQLTILRLGEMYNIDVEAMSFGGILNEFERQKAALEASHIAFNVVNDDPPSEYVVDINQSGYDISERKGQAGSSFG